MNGKKYIWILIGISLMLTPGMLAGDPLKNLALDKSANQSTTNGSAVAGRAVDGNRDSNFGHNSCTLTRTQSNPWWRLDLGKVQKINAIIITSRNDVISTFNGAEIWIGESLQISDGKTFRCAVISSIQNGQTLYIPCEASEGRYVTVLLPGHSRALSLCEVEVYHVDDVLPFPNVALKGDATQSSTLSFAAASKAIDGRRNSFYSQGFCSHTAGNETNPWWRVDLRKTYIVSSVKVTNRGDCCAERLDGAEIRIGDSLENNGNNNPRCAVIPHIRAGKTNTYYCGEGWMAGRYVNIFIPGQKKTLTICEVEVYGTTEAKPLLNLALKKHAKQSTTDLGYNASRAVDGCKDSRFSKGCCAKTEKGSHTWWRVSLTSVYKISAVTIIGSDLSSSGSLQGALIRIGHNQLHESQICGKIPSIQPTLTYTFQCADAKGRNVFVQIPGHNKTLTLCEVEVYGFQEDNDNLSTVHITPSPPPPPTPAPPPTESVVMGGRTVTLVGQRLCWSDALVYCRHHHWDLLSLHSKEEQSQVEQLLSVSHFPLTGNVWLGLRRNLYNGHMGQSQWFWMSGESMQFTSWPNDSNPNLYFNPCGAMAGGERHLWVEQSCDKLLNFICQSRPADEESRLYFFSSVLGGNGESSPLK